MRVGGNFFEVSVVGPYGKNAARECASDSKVIWNGMPSEAQNIREAVVDYYSNFERELWDISDTCLAGRISHQYLERQPFRSSL
jgi:hypothetical protein